VEGQRVRRRPHNKMYAITGTVITAAMIATATGAGMPRVNVCVAESTGKMIAGPKRSVVTITRADASPPFGTTRDATWSMSLSLSR
jgi:hypothetical protein